MRNAVPARAAREAAEVSAASAGPWVEVTGWRRARGQYALNPNRSTNIFGSSAGPLKSACM